MKSLYYQARDTDVQKNDVKFILSDIDKDISQVSKVHE